MLHLHRGTPPRLGKEDRTFTRHPPHHPSPAPFIIVLWNFINDQIAVFVICGIKLKLSWEGSGRVEVVSGVRHFLSLYVDVYIYIYKQFPHSLSFQLQQFKKRNQSKYMCTDTLELMQLKCKCTATSNRLTQVETDKRV